MHSSSSSVTALSATSTRSFKTWRRARPALRTACRWGTHSSSFHIWCRWPCDHIPATRSRWWRPCRCGTGSHQLPAELWPHLWMEIRRVFFSLAMVSCRFLEFNLCMYKMSSLQDKDKAYYKTKTKAKNWKNPQSLLQLIFACLFVLFWKY